MGPTDHIMLPYVYVYCGKVGEEFSFAAQLPLKLCVHCARYSSSEYILFRILAQPTSEDDAYGEVSQAIML